MPPTDQPTLSGAPWARHAIDETGRGADGVKLADINGDGRLDAVTGWEEDGSTRIYLNPGEAGVRQHWPKIVLPSTPSAEDAVFADLDGDGGADVITATEGHSMRLFVHWGPRDPVQRLQPEAWQRGVMGVAAGLTRWMFVQPAQIDGRNGLDLIAGGKAGGGKTRSALGWLESPASPRDLGGWKWHPLTETGWTMSIAWEDMDGDNDSDILYSDRYGATRGVYWLENRGVESIRAGEIWPKHAVGGGDAQVLFVDSGDIDGDGRRDIAVAEEVGELDSTQPSRHSRIAWFRRGDDAGRDWKENLLTAPVMVGSAKAVAIGDIDGDGRADLVLSCEHAGNGHSGVYWMRRGRSLAPSDWTARDIAGGIGVKFDVIRLVDLDRDGDLDVLTSEEREHGGGLGVIWYENPGFAPDTEAARH